MSPFELSPEQSARLEALSSEHQRGIERFLRRLGDFVERDLLTRPQAEVVSEHLLRMGERDRNPANTGNIEDLFCHTLVDTKDVIRAYAQALADSVKVVPMEPEARLVPPLRSVDGSQWYRTVGELSHLAEGDKMLVAHTMVAYGDQEMWASAKRLIEVTFPGCSEERAEQEVAKMAVQSQHLPSSSFVLARAHGLTLECGDIYAAAGYSPEQIQHAQRFYDICAVYQPEWTKDFLQGHIPQNEQWLKWREEYIDARQHLPPELIYQLSSDTLTNFLEGTLESGKWTDASVAFGGVTAPESLPQHIAQIVNQYIAEHIALHDRPASELTVACADTLRPWGIGFEDDRAVVISSSPEKAALLKEQFAAAWSRKQSD